MSDYVRALVASVVSLASFAVNIPVVFVTFRSRRFQSDSVAKLIASLAVSDICQGVMASCCAGLAWSLQPGQQAPTWLVRLINSGRYSFGTCSIWHLAAVSVVKCSIIIRPLTHFTIFTDRVVRIIVVTIWILSLMIGGATNAGVNDMHFSRVTMRPSVTNQHSVFTAGFAFVNFLLPTLIIMISYTKVFLTVRRTGEVHSQLLAGTFRTQDNLQFERAVGQEFVRDVFLRTSYPFIDHLINYGFLRSRTRDKIHTHGIRTFHCNLLIVADNQVGLQKLDFDISEREGSRICS